MHTGFTNVDLEAKAKELVPDSDSRCIVRISIGNNRPYRPTSIEYLNDGTKESRLAIVHHLPDIQRSQDNFKIMESIFENNLTEEDTLKKSLYFYWLQIHDAPFERGTSSITELFVKSILTHSNISYQEQDPGFSLDYHALLYTPDEFKDKVLHQLRLKLIMDTSSSDFKDINSDTIMISPDIFPVVDSSSQSKENSVDELLQKIQDWSLYNLDMGVACTQSSIAFSSIAHEMSTICTLFMPHSHQEMNKSLVSLFLDVESAPCDPNNIMRQLTDINFDDTTSITSKFVINKIGFQRCLSKASQLIKLLQQEEGESDNISEKLWFYLRIQSHILARFKESVDSDKVAKKNTEKSVTVFSEKDRYYKKVKRLLSKTSKDLLNISISKCRLRSGENGLVITQKPCYLENKKHPIFEPLNDVFNTPLPNKEIVSKMFQFYWRQIHNASFSRGTELVSEMCVKSVLSHFDIHYQQPDITFKLGFEALVLPEAEFVSTAISVMCPDSNACCSIS